MLLQILKLATIALAFVTLPATGCGWRPKHESIVRNASYFRPDTQYGEFLPQSEREQAPEFPPSVIDGLPNIDTFTISLRIYDAYLPDSDATTAVSESVAASQSVTIITDALKDEDGLLEGSVSSDGGREGTRPILNALIEGEKPPYYLLVDDPIRLGPHKVAVRLHTSTGTSSDGINWSVTITIDGEFSEPRYAIVGRWCGAHAADIEINGVQVYRHEAAVQKKPPTTPVDADAKDAKSKKINWELWKIFTRPERSVTSADIHSIGRLRKPEYRP